MESEMSIHDQIEKATIETLLEMGVHEVRFAVEWPADLAHGDYAVNAALAAAKELGMNPRELASELAPRIAEKLSELASSVEVAGPGFINITLSPMVLEDQIKKAAHSAESRTAEDKSQTPKDESRWGSNSSQYGKRVIIEYSCPNPFKEMHVGHMMSTIIGESIARLIEASGAVVARDTYGGDVGPHVAKALWALQKENIAEPATAEEIGKAYAHGSRAYEESEEAKAEIDTLNQELYKVVDANTKGRNSKAGARASDTALMGLWRKGRDVSLEAFRELYRILDTHFDYFFFESETAPIGMDVVKDGLARGVFEESEGAIIYKGEKKGLHTLVFVTSRGTPTYEAKDVGLAFLKEERWPSDESIIITAAEQVGHFKVFLAALEDIAPLLAAKTQHVSHGFLRLTTGKMSSREGNVITADSLIREVLQKSAERNEDSLIAEHVAMAAIKYSILRSSAGSDIIFDMEKSLSLDGDSGPYLQYATVRAKSVIANADNSTREENEESSVAAEKNQARNSKTSAKPFALERLIIRFPEIVQKAEKNLAPHTIAQYLLQLASEWNSFYAQERIIGSADEARKIQIANAFVNTMENGLALLGISVPERM